MADPASEKEQRKVEDSLDAAAIAFELSVLGIIAERLGALKGATMAEVYAAMPEDIARIRQAVADGTRNIQKVADDAIRDMAAANDEWAAKYYGARQIEQQSAITHSVMSQTVRNAAKRTADDIGVKCRSSVIEVLDTETGVMLPCEQAYRRIVERAAVALTTGEATAERVIGQSVRTMANGGLRVRYRSGNTRNLNTSIRTNVMDAYRTAMTELREIQGREFGADGVEVSAHALCAPDHQEYQGMQYSLERRRGYELWDEVQNRPARPLVTGANCGHTVFPVILGISSSAYTREELKGLRDRSNESVTFKGVSGKELTMSRYDASQYQRGLENTIRKNKETAYLLKESGEDSSGYDRAVRRYTSEYKRVSGEVGLTPRMENTKIFIAK